MSEYILKNNKESRYYSFFNTKNGVMLRQSYNKEEPFMRYEGPELLDISITNYCENNCNFCYRRSNINGKHMKIEEYRKIVDEASSIGVQQIALGGGNPNQHPDFIDILKVTRENKIIPSYTTNGQGLSEKIIKATKEYCGAVAVSLYEPYRFSFKAIEKLISNNIKTNIHFILNKDTIENAINILNRLPNEINGINAMIFLNYKSQKKYDELYLKKSNKLQEFFDIINYKELPFKIGFDSCSISFIVNNIKNLNVDSVDFCESSRFSAFISEDLKMYPCSFMINVIEGEDLRIKSIKKAWREGTYFKIMREKLKNNECRECGYFSICHGGCPIFNINQEDCIKK